MTETAAPHDPVIGELVELPSFGELEREWRALEARAEPPFFVTWGWLGPWVRTVPDRRATRLFRARCGEATVALAFVHVATVRRRRGLLAVRQAQLNEVAGRDRDMIIEYNGLLSARGFEAASWKSLARALHAAREPWDELVCRSLDQTTFANAAAAFPGLRPELDREFPTWVVALTPAMQTEDVLLAAFRKKTRQQMRQSLRAFSDFGPSQVTVARDAAEALHLFDQMRELHTARWSRVGKAGSFANPLWVAFHREVIAMGVPRGEVVVARIDSGAECLGYIYGFRRKSRFYAQQTGFRVFEAAALRAGFTSHFRLMQWLAGQGVTAYDFLPDDAESYKRLFGEPGPPATSVRFQRQRTKLVVEGFVLRAYRALRPAPAPAKPPVTSDRDS